MAFPRTMPSPVLRITSLRTMLATSSQPESLTAPHQHPLILAVAHSQTTPELLEAHILFASTTASATSAGPDRWPPIPLADSLCDWPRIRLAMCISRGG